MKIFLDTEFTDLRAPVLISLGMAAETGEDFYVELPYADTACSPFVLEKVLPLLGTTPGAACSFRELRQRILSWLESVRQAQDAIFVCVDYQTDWDLFAVALEDRIPEWCRFLHVGRNINALLRYEYHKIHCCPEHHALHDARANRYAFRERLPIAR